ncbi:DNA-methyltransferase [Delftia acidovorans]|uniref:DNA-methyltransferase n=1 Tax=Delftia acidovorans TaxID=80866 RepID=UPI00062D0938|nr:site-specific DNA-methyltransferase [Delftia acidovorans]
MTLQAIECRQIGNATIYRGDCLQVLAQLGLQVDALITDPPYSSGGTTSAQRMRPPSEKYVQSDSSRYAEHNANFLGDNRDQRSWAFWCSSWLSLARDLLTPGGYAMVFTDWRQLPTLTDAFQAGGLLWRGVVPWDKTESARSPHKGYFRHQCEYVVWGSNGSLPVSVHGGPWPGLVRERVDHRQKLHMTGKPVELMSALVQAVPPGGVILDPFMGSASTGVAALQAGYRFIGIEQDQHYFDVATSRLEQCVAAL